MIANLDSQVQNPDNKSVFFSITSVPADLSKTSKL